MIELSTTRKNVLSSIALSLSQVLFPLITFPYASRILHPEGVGLVTFTDSFAQFFVYVAGLGIPIYGVREVAKRRGNRLELNKVTSELLAIHLIATFACLLAFVCITQFSVRLRQSGGLFMIGYAILLSNAFLFEWFFQGIEEFTFIVRRSVFFKMVTVVLLFLLVRTAADTGWYYGLTLLSLFCSALVNMYYARRFVTISFRKLAVKQHLRPLFFLFATVAATSIYVILDNVILGFISGERYVGYYSTAMRISRISTMMVSAAGVALVPRLSALLNDGDVAGARKLLEKSLQLVVLLSVPIAFGTILLAPEFVLLFGGEKFLESVKVLRMVAFSALFIGLAQVFSLQILLPLHRERDMLTSIGIATLISLLLNFTLIPAYRHVGAAGSSLLTELVGCTLLWYFSRKKMMFHLPFRALFAATVSCIGFFPLKKALELTGTSLATTTVLVVASCALSYFLIQWVLFRNELKGWIGSKRAAAHGK